MSELKQIVKEELKVSYEKLKAEGKQVAKEQMEDIAIEMAEMMGRVAVRSSNKIDDFYLAVKPLLVNELDKIDGQEG